jgi:uncharacterized protein (TIGR00369 family)
VISSGSALSGASDRSPAWAARAHPGDRQAEHVGDVLVGAALLQHERDDGALVRSEGIERAHPCTEVWCQAVIDRPQLPWREIPGFDRALRAADRHDVRGEITAHVEMRDELRQPAGLLHGGVLASMAESMATIPTYFAVQAEGMTAQGLANQTNFLRPFLSGTIHAVARRRHRGRTTWCGRWR